MHYLEKELYDRITEGDQVFDFLQKNVLDGIWYIDLENSNNQFFTPEFYKVFGYKDIDISENGNLWSSLIHPDDLKKSEELMAKHLANPEIPFEQIIRYQHKNGNSIWIRSKGISIRNEHGKPIRMLGVHAALNVSSLRELNTSIANSQSQDNDNFTQNKQQFFGQLYEDEAKNEGIESFFKDVSERIKLTNQINSKNELLAHLVEKTTDSVLIFNEKLQLIYANKQIEQYIGRKIEKFPIELSESLNIIHPSHQAMIYEIYETARQNKEKTVIEQHLANHVDGKLVWLEDHVSFEYDSEGNYKRAYIISRNITERKLIEHSLEQESLKYKEIAELVIEEKEIGKEELYKNLKDTVEHILIDAKNDIEISGYQNNKYIQAAFQHITTAINEVHKITIESSSLFVFENYFVPAIKEYFDKINYSSKIQFEVQNLINLPTKLNELQKKHIFRICQELSQNTTKHSNANKMVFRFKKMEDNFILIAKDNGTGNSEYKVDSGVGIKNIQNRVYLMNGTIRFFFFKKTGLAIYIAIKIPTINTRL
jgi:PAS domain S-box-containing protein